VWEEWAIALIFNEESPNTKEQHAL